MHEITPPSQQDLDWADQLIGQHTRRPDTIPDVRDTGVYLGLLIGSVLGFAAGVVYYWAVRM